MTTPSLARWLAGCVAGLLMAVSHAAPAPAAIASAPTSITTPTALASPAPATPPATPPAASAAAPVSSYAVVVGDSIAEGEPELKGRLNYYGQFKADLPSSPGQLSYELASRFGVFHFNHGMGGQTSTQVRTRWPRDVLAQQFEVGDGRPARTLPAGTLPVTVFLHVGINDLIHGLSLAQMQANFDYFAQSTAQARIPLIVDNVGAYLGMTPELARQADAFNLWLREDLARRHANVTVIDYLDWSSGGTGDYLKLAPGKFADGVHPSRAGYVDLADFVQRSLSPARGR